MAAGSGPNVSSGRRGYLRYAYGNHYWVPEIQAGWTRGMIRDTAVDAIPPGGVLTSFDFLLHIPGEARKRGGTTYPFAALTGATTMSQVAHVAFRAAGVGNKVVSIGSNSHLFSNATDIGATSAVAYCRLAVSPGGAYVILPYADAANAQKFDGTTISTLGAGMKLSHVTSYKSRLVASSANANEQNRLYFSNTPDVNSAWDTANLWMDCDNQITGLAALNNALLIFSANGMERIIGSVPPGTVGTDMDRAPISPIGCTDCRSIVQVGPNVFFANPQGVYMTNGSTPVDLTAQGGMSTYWRRLFGGTTASIPWPTSSTSIVSGGYWNGFLFMSVPSSIATLMCHVETRAWWLIQNVKANAYATSVDGTDLFYADGATNRVTSLAGILDNTGTDASGSPVLPSIQFAPFGNGPGVKDYGFGRLDYWLQSAAASPTLGIIVYSGMNATDSTFTPAESPLVEGPADTISRRRFSICRSSQIMTIGITQTAESDYTRIYAVEVEARPMSMVGDGST